MRDQARTGLASRTCNAARCALALVLAASAVTAHAQTYPVKPVRIISPYPPGGLGDLLPRAIAIGLSEAREKGAKVPRR